jgi:hypothetical protein
MMKLPPRKLPPLPDPYFDDQPGPYSASALRDVCGTRINPNAKNSYNDRNRMISPGGPFSCVHPEIEEWIGSAEGFDPRSRIKQPPMKEWPLSVVAARIDARNTPMPFDLPEMTYFVDYSSFHKDLFEGPAPGGLADTVKERLFPENSQLVLTFYNEKVQKLNLWSIRNFWQLPFLEQFDAVLMPDFHAYCNDPVPKYLIGERMMQIFAEEGSRAGRTVIPSIAWSTEESLRRQVDLWTSQSNINTIRLDCLGAGVHRTGWAWRWIFALEKYVQGMDHIRWIITGMTSGWTIGELNRIFPKKNYTLVTPFSTFIAAQRRSTSREWSTHEFRRQIKRLEEFRSGKNVAEAMTRPAVWPTFADVVKPRGSKK